DGASVDDVWIVGTASADGMGVANPVLMVHWDGSNLVEYATPGLGNRQNDLYDVAVVSSDDVWAVGEWISWGVGNASQHGMIFHWDGTAWSHVPNPTETIDNVDLHTVAAIATDDVWVAGDDTNGPLFMHWDGSSWTIVPSPPTTGTIQHLAPISSDDIWAVDSAWQLPSVGKYYHWNGSAWSIVNVAAPPGATQQERHGGLAVVGACDVWSVGSVYYGTGSVIPYIERLGTGGAVTGVPEAVPGGPGLAVTPNPMRSLARIQAERPGTPITQARIHDVTGTVVRHLTAEAARGGTVMWDGRDEHGRSLPSGVYFVRARNTEGQELSSKVTLLR
ncbi:MAG: hypothetical protein HKN12_00070, partial [Gemmatimonadetes bacterium]|nr:hypothetical protein [Gemmatimonadota bacterium]